MVWRFFPGTQAHNNEDDDDDDDDDDNDDMNPQTRQVKNKCNKMLDKFCVREIYHKKLDDSVWKRLSLSALFSHTLFFHIKIKKLVIAGDGNDTTCSITVVLMFMMIIMMQYSV